MTVGFIINPYRFAAGFDPMTIAGLKLWLKADGVLYQDSARTTLATADGHPVGSWSDASTSATHAQQTTSTRRPLLKLNQINGLPVVRPDGIDDYLDLSTMSIASGNKTIVAVTTRASAPLATEHFLDSEAGRLILWYGRFGNDAWYDNGEKVFAASVTGVHITTWVLNSTGTNGLIYRDGAAEGAAQVYSAKAIGGSTALFGVYAGFAGAPAGMDLAELLIYNSALSDADRQYVEAGLKAKWGTP